MAGPGTPASFHSWTRDSGTSGINVDGLPPLPDFDLIEQQTATLRTAGTTISTNVNAAAGNWRGLASVYEAPEAPIVLSGFAPVLAHARQLETALSSAISCLNDYAMRSRELKGKAEALRRRVSSLDDLIGANGDWRADPSIVDQRHDLFSAVSALAQEIHTSDAACATGLNAIHGDGTVTAPSIPVGGSSDPTSNFFTNALHALGSDEELPDQPWGTATVPYRMGGRGSFAQGFSSSLLGTLEGAYTLFGTTDKVKQAQAWQGMATLAAAGLATYNLVHRGFKDASKSDIEAVITVWGAAKSVVHYDEWLRDPQYASGAVSFDVASLFVPGGAGIGAKAGGVAGHAGVAGARSGHLLEEAATAGRLTGKIGELPAKASAALNGVAVRAWENTLRPALDNLAGALNRLDEGTATVRVVDGVTAAGHGPFAGAADNGYRTVDRADLTEAPRHAENAPARHRAEGPVDSVTPLAHDSAPAPREAGDAVAVEDPTSGPPSHVADNGADSGSAHSDQQTAGTLTDPALAEQSVLAEAATKVERLDTAGIAYCAPDGSTVPTPTLVHPRADLEQLVFPKQKAGVGLGAESPPVRRQLPENFRMWDGKTREAYVELHANGNRPNGAPLIRDDAWPDDQLHPEGFLTPESRTPVVLQPGHLIDRYGLPRGRYTSPVGENFPDRALPDFSLERFGRRDGYHQYEVLHEIPAWAGPVAPALGKAGGATQYYTNMTIGDLLTNGFIREVTPQ